MKVYKEIQKLNWDNRQYLKQYEKKSVSNMNSKKSSLLVDNDEPFIVIDNGSFEVRAGFSYFEEPQIIVKNLVGKNKVQIKNSNVEFVGEDLFRLDPSKINKKNPFEKNYIAHFGTQESVLDYVFSSLNLTDLNHPIIITEPFLNLSYSRRVLNEMLFELYGASKLSTGVDFMFSSNEYLKENGIVISSGYNYTHVVPILNGKPVIDCSRRFNIGGYHHHDYLSKILPLKYPFYRTKMSPEIIQHIQENFTECAASYEKQNKLLQNILLSETKRIEQENLKSIYGSLDMYNKVLEKECKYIENEKNTKNRKSGLYTYKSENQKDVNLYKNQFICGNVTEKNIENKMVDWTDTSCDSNSNNHLKLIEDENTHLYKNQIDFENYLLDKWCNIDKKENKEIDKINNKIIVVKENLEFVQNKLKFIEWPETYGLITLSEEEIKKKEEMRIEQGLRLKEILNKKREEKLIKKKEELSNLTLFIESKKSYSEDDFLEEVQSKGFENEKELLDCINKLKETINKSNFNQDQQIEDDEMEVINDKEKWPLIDVPDEELDESQIKLKRIQKMQRSGYYARLEKKEALKREKEEIEFLKSNNPEHYIISLFLKKKKLLEKLDYYEKLRKDMLNRRSKVNISRMMVLAELGKDESNTQGSRSKREKSFKSSKITDSFNKKKKSNNLGRKKESEEDAFGEKDEDWDVYRGISKQNLSEEEDEDRNTLVQVDNDIAEMLPDHFKNASKFENSHLTSDFEKYCYLGIDQFKGAELLFNPQLIGIDQAGLSEIIDIVLKCFSLEDKTKLLSCVFLTGGNMSYTNIENRIFNELKSISPYGSEINVFKPINCSLNAWYGARNFGLKGKSNIFVSKQEYMEKGYDYILEHEFSNQNKKK